MPTPPAHRSVVLPLLAVLACAAAAGAQDGEQESAARRTFLRACATCHGEDGSGTGPTVLDRPARDFKSGGFSFGNTPDALFRTITYGIPGTPMPAFGEAFPEDERLALADYVRSLGPATEELDVSDRVVVVTDRPRVVRGILPPVVEDAAMHPRGLLVGTPQGLSFEYRIDDVRLLAVRHGDFVERTDWVGRGGTPLQPLGVPLLVHGNGEPPAPFRHRGTDVGPAAAAAATVAHELAATLSSTQERADHVVLHYELRRDGERVARVTDTLRAAPGAVASGWDRELVVDGSRQQDLLVDLSLDPIAPKRVLETLGDAGRPDWIVASLPDGRALCLRPAVEAVDADASQGPAPAWGTEPAEDALRLLIPVVRGRATRVTLRTVLLPQWNAAARSALLEEAAAR